LIGVLGAVFFGIGALMVVFSGLAGEPTKNVNKAVRGIGLLLMIVPSLLLAIAGYRLASRGPV
jgi:hypothetical protein